MRRHRLVCSIILCFAFAAVVGGQPPKQPDAPVKFELKLEKNKSFYQQVTTTLTQGIKVMGQDLTQTQESTFSFKWTPVKQEGDKWELTDEIESVKMSIDISGNSIKYDSTQAEGGSTPSNPALMEFFKKLIGAKFTVTFDAKALKVEKVEGIDEFVNLLKSGNQNMDKMLKEILSSEALKHMCDPTLGVLPDTPKKVGEKWSKAPETIALGPIGSYTVKRDFTFAGVEKDLDKFDVTMDVTYNAPKPDAPGGGLLFRIKEGALKSEAPTKGTVLYDPKAGRVASAEFDIKLKGDLTVDIGGTPTKVELLQTQKTKLATQDATFLPKAK